jgi:hypothetical protein
MPQAVKQDLFIFICHQKHSGATRHSHALWVAARSSFWKLNNASLFFTQ